MENLPTDYWVKSAQFTKHTYHDVYPAIDPTKPENSLAEKVVIVTGASRGIGAEGIAPAFAQAGVRGLVLVATSAEKLAAVEKSLNAAYPKVQTLAVPTDIADGPSVEALFARVAARFGHADVLVNSAGALTGQGAAMHDVDAAEWWRNYETNAKGAFLLGRGLVRALPDPAGTPAALISLGTLASFRVVPGFSGYGPSKLVAQVLAAHLAAAYPNLTAVTLHPGLVDTDMMQDMFRRFDLDTPALVGGTAVWLAGGREVGERAKFLSGRMVAANWSVEDLAERRGEIERDGLLLMDLKGRFGAGQFEE